MTEEPLLSPTPGESAPATSRSAPGKGFLAASGSVVFPGIGQWIAGYPRRGVIWFGLMAAGLVTLGVSLAFVPTIVVAWVLTVVCTAFFAIVAADAFACGRDSARRLLGSSAARHVAGVGLLVLAAGTWFGIAKIGSAALRAAGVRYRPITTIAMRPTLLPGDLVIARRVPNLRRWDIVIFRPPGRTDIFTQRIAGLPGEKVEIVGGQLRINDTPVPPPPGVDAYTSHTEFGPQTGCEGHPIRLGPGEYFLLGDNSAVAYDSRSFPDAAPGHPVGVVPRESILGRVIAIDWPPRRMHEFK
ncbi:MAG TPA: signal peptidase I [Tepidisphaeraceae bacterium]